MRSFEYEFVAQPVINERLANQLNSPEAKEDFLVRLAKTLGNNPRGAGQEITNPDSLFKGKRKLDHLDEELGLCVVAFRVERNFNKVVVYAVRPMG